MARGALPDPLTRRHLLERDLSKDHAIRIAEAYLAEERRQEALAFLSKAKDTERLRTLREAAIAEGDAFLLKETTRALAEPTTTEQWMTLARSAADAGKTRYAAQAQRQAERREG